MTEAGARGGVVTGAKAHWTGIAEAAHDALAAKMDARKMAHVAGVLERFESEIVPHLIPFLADHAENPNLPPEVRDLLGALVNPEHFTQSVLVGIAIGAVISPVLASITAPTAQLIASEVWAKQPVNPLSPDLLAASVIKGVLTESEAAGEALQSGVNAQHFGTMVNTAGQSFGVGEALLLLRRKQIDQAEFDRIVRYSNTRNDFIPDLLKLMYAPPAAGEVIAGAVKAHLTDAEAQAKLAEAGIDPANYAWLKASAGRPYGIEQALQLWNRGLIDQARVEQVIAQSDVNPTFTPDILGLRVYLPPPRSVVPMLRNGAITEARARTLLMHHGLSAEDADAFIAEAHHTKASAAKELTGAQVLRMFADGFLTAPDATARLVKVGYPADEITLLLDFATHQRAEKLTNALLSKVGTLYVSHHIDKAEAQGALTAGAVPAAAQADAFHVWDLERAANVHHPTTAQVVGAYRRGEIPPLECRTRLLSLGVLPADLALFVADGWPPTKGAEARAAAALVVNA